MPVYTAPRERELVDPAAALDEGSLTDLNYLVAGMNLRDGAGSERADQHDSYGEAPMRDQHLQVQLHVMYFFRPDVDVDTYFVLNILAPLPLYVLVGKKYFMF